MYIYYIEQDKLFNPDYMIITLVLWQTLLFYQLTFSNKNEKNELLLANPIAKSLKWEKS
jgi:hypothetical protein